MEQIKSISIFVVILPFLFGFAEVPQNAPVSDGVSDVGNTTTTVEKPPDVPFYGQETIVIEPDRKFLTDDSPVEDIVPSVTTSTEESIYCSCILTARFYGLDLPKTTYIGDLEPNVYGNLGIMVGDGILLSYPNTEHIALITGLSIDGYEIVEGNYKPCEKTSRIIAYDDERIRGFWRNLDN